MDIVLIYPYIGDMDVIRDKPHLPLPLIQAATLIVRNYSVQIIDIRLNPFWSDLLASELDKNPLYFGLSVMSGQPIASALKVSQFIKKKSNIPVVWGGNHPTLSPYETISNPAVDIVVIGDGEETLLELSDKIASSKSLRNVKGLWYKENGQIVKNEPRDPVDLDFLPLPPYHLVDTDDYVQEYRGRRMLNIETSRGCKYKCRYCYHTGGTGFHGFRSLNIEKSLERIYWACDEFNVEGVYLIDDNFFLNKKRGMEIVRNLVASQKTIYWQIQGVDVPSMLGFKKQELREMELSRLKRISVGAESGSPDTLRYVSKPHTVDMLIEANKLWSNYDINIFYNWLAGFPSETIEDVKKTIGMMFQMIRDNPHARLSPLYNFFPFPGTALWYEVIEKHGFEPPESLADWGGYDWNCVNVSYLSKKMKRTLENLYYASLCIDHKFEDFAIPKFLYWAIKMYRPFARLRMKNLFYHFPVEKYAAKFVEGIMSKNKQSQPWAL
jgi:radical SAM superfamily enzyme YgiQ (UPF0313 family)